mmetsp:Transcript_1563/g.5150  ORF Transcript_1563/g.5150 Transcript_1563/m.5150 type:complete len:243 (+) Transcript_1563:951-1679(+)
MTSSMVPAPDERGIDHRLQDVRENTGEDCKRHVRRRQNAQLRDDSHGYRQGLLARAENERLPDRHMFLRVRTEPHHPGHRHVERQKRQVHASPQRQPRENQTRADWQLRSRCDAQLEPGRDAQKHRRHTRQDLPVPVLPSRNSSQTLQSDAGKQRAQHRQDERPQQLPLVERPWTQRGRPQHKSKHRGDGKHTKCAGEHHQHQGDGRVPIALVCQCHARREGGGHAAKHGHAHFELEWMNPR